MLYRNSLSLSVFQCMLAIWSLVPLPFLKPAWTSGSSWFIYCWSLARRILSITLLACDRMKQGKDYRVLPRQPTGHNKHPLPTIQEKTLHMDITRWSIWKSDWLYSLQPKMEKLYTVSQNKTESWLWPRSWAPYCQIQTEIEESMENHYAFQVRP